MDDLFRGLGPLTSSSLGPLTGKLLGQAEMARRQVLALIDLRRIENVDTLIVDSCISLRVTR